MFTCRTNYDFHSDGRSCHSRGGRSFGRRSGCGSLDDVPCDGRALPSHPRRGTCGRRGDGMAWGREGASQLENSLCQRRRGSIEGLMDGLGGMNLGGGSGGLGSPIMPRGPLGSPRGSLSLGGRSPLLGNHFLGHRLYPQGGLSLHGLSSRSRSERLSPLMSGSPRLGLQSRMGSTPSLNSFDLYRMDRRRMPYGPRMGGLSNYMSPYVEDYESVMDEHELEMMLRDRALTEALEYRDGMLHSPFLDDSYGDDLGDLRGRRLR